MCSRCNGDLVTLDSVDKAIKMVSKTSNYFGTSLEKELASSLKKAQDEGTFDGLTLKSAVKSLVLAGYEISKLT